MEIKRAIQGKLSAWKRAPDRKPLVLQGARQVGNQAEVDFLIQVKNEIIPVEVKSDENVRSKSLTVYHNLYQPPVRIRYSLKNLKSDNGLLNIPLFMIDYTDKLLKISSARK